MAPTVDLLNPLPASAATAAKPTAAGRADQCTTVGIAGNVVATMAGCVRYAVAMHTPASRAFALQRPSPTAAPDRSNVTTTRPGAAGVLASVLALLASPLCGANTATAPASQPAGAATAALPKAPPPAIPAETPEQRDARMQWWREARFGLFIHWGLYAVPAGTWGDRTNHGEWIRTTAQIPLDRYDQFREEFNPIQFEPGDWMALAREAGMRYAVITTKHHDGFCLFESALTDFDISSTPYGRDIIQEYVDAARANDLVPCFYHSIMDWHHPDYLPRRGWETTRSAEGADMDRYERYLSGQVTELLTKYGPIGVMWFDGEWEDTWNSERGRRLYALCRRLQPQVIVNNRVDKGRNDMEGLTREGAFLGDFGTPEQQVPPRGIPGVDWEACITMNANWGWNEADLNWKSSDDLIRMLVDIVSKGGNLLLNVGPMADGRFPKQAIERLRTIGAWMKINGEAIHGTTASRFDQLDWGRASTRINDQESVVYLHLFERPADGALVVPGLWTMPGTATVLGASDGVVGLSRGESGWTVHLSPEVKPAPVSVIKLEFPGPPEIFGAPTMSPAGGPFLDRVAVTLAPTEPGAGLEVRYTLDGSAPTSSSPTASGPIEIASNTTVNARTFRHDPSTGRPTAVGSTSSAQFTRLVPRAPLANSTATVAGVSIAKYVGSFSTVPDWSTMTATERVRGEGFTIPQAFRGENVLLIFEAELEVVESGLYDVSLMSDDGSRLWIGSQEVIENDGPHGPRERRGAVALEKGRHAIRVALFNRTGGFDLELRMGLQGKPLAPIEKSRLWTTE